MKKLFRVRPCLKRSPTKAISRCQHHIQRQANITPSLTTACTAPKSLLRDLEGVEAKWFFCSSSQRP